MAIKAQTLHHQVADEMRRSIQRGRWLPGTQIPTEDKLCQTYGVSRPTIRLAVAALRTEGLLDVQQGRGTFVRASRPEADRATIDRTSPSSDPRQDWHDTEPPSVSHVRLAPTAAELLDLPAGEAAFLVERLLTHEPTGARARQLILIPMERMTGTPLAKEPRVTTAATAFDILAAVHGPLEWRENVTARMPRPDEREALHATEATPLLVSQRIARTQDARHPVMLDTPPAPADAFRFAFTVRPGSNVD